jgi:hypothetical protein
MSTSMMKDRLAVRAHMAKRRRAGPRPPAPSEVQQPSHFRTTCLPLLSNRHTSGRAPTRVPSPADMSVPEIPDVGKCRRHTRHWVLPPETVHGRDTVSSRGRAEPLREGVQPDQVLAGADHLVEQLRVGHVDANAVAAQWPGSYHNTNLACANDAGLKGWLHHLRVDGSFGGGGGGCGPGGCLQRSRTRCGRGGDKVNRCG